MKTATVTYVAPFGDSKVVEMGGVTFFDGKSVEINSYDNPVLFKKIQGNPYFDIAMGKDEPDTIKPKVKRGRPSAADLAERQAAADKAEQEHKDATEKLKDAKADAAEAEKASKAEGKPNPVGFTGTSSAPTPAGS